MALAIRVNDFLTGLFLGIGIQPRRLQDGVRAAVSRGEMMRIIVADEISPDSCRLWDIKSTHEKLDKDRFRRDHRRSASKRTQEVAKPARHPDRERTAEAIRPGAGVLDGRPEVQAALKSSRPDAGMPGRTTRQEQPDVIKARVTVTLKNGVLDPQGKAIEHALSGLGFDGVGSVRQGKVFDLELDGTDAEKAEAALKAMCDKLLANTVIENYSVNIAQ